MASKLGSREYKLLLDPRQFQRKFSQTDADDFLYKLNDKLKPFRRLLPPAFDKFESRPVQFWDLQNCALTANDLALRCRGNVGKEKVTLKLRKADFFIAKSFYDKNGPYKDQVREARLEEDIAPLEVKPKGADASIVMPIEHSIRSRYSCSITFDAKIDADTADNNVWAWFPQLNDSLGIKVEPSGRTLIAGDAICEGVAKGGGMQFSHGVEGELALTLWRFTKNDAQPNPADAAPEIAEISFKYKTDNGDVPARVAREAYDLFIAMQSSLDINMSDASKTSLALPRRCACY